jgi:predicted metal-dependent hydrolase
VSLESLRRGIELVNKEKYFEAHEVLEDLWRAAPADEKRFFQGLVQVAVAFHHYTQGNLTGAKSVLRRAIMNLASGPPPSLAELDHQALLNALSAWQQAMNGEGPRPDSLPRIQLKPRQVTAP